MSICSVHQVSQPNCPQCQITEEVLLQNPFFAKMIQEAKEAGEHTCICGFTYYKTVDNCPLCNAPR